MWRIAFAAAGLTMVWAASAGAAERTVELRHYGRTSASEQTLEGGVRRLKIVAETEEKAKLWQAKFLSDLTLEGVGAKRETLKGMFGLRKADAYRAPNGWLGAARSGREVHCYFAPTGEAMYDALKGYGREATMPAAAVPASLDANERWAFRFYYRMGCKPEGRETYDQREDVLFCKTNGLGLVFWTGGHWADTAANVPADGQWGYMLDLCRREGVPVVLNFNPVEYPLVDFYAKDMNSRQPGYMGGFVRFGTPHYGGAGHLSVDHPAANAHGYEANQAILRKYGKENVISLHEVNGELNHGDHNIFLNYGPEADRSFRKFLKKRYGTLEAYSQAMHGDGKRIGSWDEVRFPEIAEFAGWGTESTDLAGEWMLKYTDKPEEADFAEAEPQGEGWLKTAKMPGDDSQLFHERKTAVLRRTFEYEPDGKPVWLYLWDLNKKFREPVEVWLNGKLLKREKIPFNYYHWMYAEASGLLKKGRNTIALRLPEAIIGYKIYLTKEKPAFYPYAGRARNLLWTDSIDWNTSRRVATIEQSMDSMRAVDPDNSTVLMAPRSYSRQLREIARLRGGRFHDTGSMGACFHEELPMLMRGANLPFTLEPGGPAPTAERFRRLMGLYMSQGVNAIHYFIHVGNVSWDPEICAEFLRALPALKMLGKSRQMQGDAAWVIDSDVNKYLGYPWCRDFNIAFPSGYWAWRFNQPLRDYMMDAIIPEDFANGLADRYKVVLDCNNTIIGKAGVEAIRRWVEKGGTYVAMFQTGRHSRTAPDAWEMAELTGYRGEVFAKYTPEGWRDDKTCRHAEPTEEGRAELPNLRKRYRDTGTALRKVAADATDLIKWEDGSVAAGVRKVGKGKVYTVGIQLSEHSNGHGIRYGEIIGGMLDGAGVRKDGFTAARNANIFETKRFTSNNGLYDVWYVWNPDGKEVRGYRIEFDDGEARVLTDVLTGKTLPLAGKLEPYGFLMGVSPRKEAAEAMAVWFDRQCGDNQGVVKGKFEPPQDGYGANTLEIGGGWNVNGVPGGQLGFWEKGVDSGVVSNFNVAARTVQIPEAWRNGKTYLSHAAMYDGTCMTRGGKGAPRNSMSVKMNGKALELPRKDEGFSLVELPGVKGGDAIELEFAIGSHGDGRYTGSRGSTFLAFVPDPKRTIPLAGEWRMREKMLAEPWSEPAKLPGRLEPKCGFFSRSVDLPALKDGERMVFHAEDRAGAIYGVIINGNYVRRHHHRYGRIVNIDVTAFAKPGKNEVTMVLSSGYNEVYRVEMHVK